LSLNMRPAIVSLDIKDIVTIDVEEDEIFSKKYIDFLTGKSNAYLTRISLSRIKPGFYKRHNNMWKYVIDDINKEHLELMIREIRIGFRPTLHLYENLNENCPFDFVCSDDVVIYEAYKVLGIKQVPSILLGTKKGLEESAFISKRFEDSGENRSYFIYSTVNINNNLYTSLLGPNPDISTIEGIAQLEIYFQKLKLNLKKFHLPGTFEIHYHEVMYSILIRIEEMLKSIKILLTEGLTFQATCILRSLYELSLNFYVSWLSPIDMIQMLQISSVISEAEWKKICESRYKEQMDNGLSQQKADAIKKTKQYQYSFVNKVIEKARFSPLGETFYTETYTFLSDIVHHDFSMSARYKSVLELGDTYIFDADILTDILRLTDISATMVYTRIRDDIGVTYDE